MCNTSNKLTALCQLQTEPRMSSNTYLEFHIYIEREGQTEREREKETINPQLSCQYLDNSLLVESVKILLI